MRRIPVAAVVVDILRHALPVLPLYLLHGSFPRYLVLTAFDLSLGLMLIVGSTRERGDINSVDPRSRWMILQVVSVLIVAVFLALMAAVIAVPIGLPAYIFGLRDGVDWQAAMSRPDFWVPVGGMSLLAAIRYQTAFYARTTPGRRGQPTSAGPVIGDLEGDRRQSLAAKAAQVTLLATFAGLCYVSITFGRAGLHMLPILYAALLVSYDIRPDLAERIFPVLWQER
jgi:hypothetical protein